MIKDLIKALINILSPGQLIILVSAIILFTVCMILLISTIIFSLPGILGLLLVIYLIHMIIRG